MQQADPHQNLELLHAYGLGKIDGGAVDTIASHLETCVECRRVVAAVPADQFLSDLQGASARPDRGEGRNDSDFEQGATIQSAAALNDRCPEEPISSVMAPPTKPPRLADPIPPGLAASPDYGVIREINRGGMGIVYLVRNRRMDRLEGLKVVNEALLKRAGALERFEREMRSAARLNHPNIVAAYSSPPLEGLLAFAMEYVDGVDLQQVVDACGPLPVSEACFYVYQAAQGLQHAHERQMVHRDIKPGNLMLLRDRTEQVIKILDFGLAKATSENPVDAALTDAGQMLGTPHYMAPEQIVAAAEADIRADIYSLGCTLYHLLTGGPPFKEKRSVYEILEAHRREEAWPLNEMRPDVPLELAMVVGKMMAKAVAERYQQPAQVAQSLIHFIPQGQKAISENGTAPMPRAFGENSVQRAAAEVVASSRETLLSARRRRERARQSPVRLTRVKAWVGAALGIVVVGMLAAWGRGVFKVKIREGTLVIDVNEPGAEVFVDNERVTLTWADAENGGQQAEVNVQPGEHRIKITKNGFSVAAKKLTFREGYREIFTAKLVPADKPPAAVKGRPKQPTDPSSAVVPPDRPRHGPSLLRGHSDIVWGVAFSPDGERLVSGSKDGTVRHWDIRTALQTQEIANRSETWRTVAWSPDGTLIATGGNSNVALWDGKTGAAVGGLTGHNGQIRGLAFSADSRQIATSSCDSQVKLWNVADRTAVKNFSGHTGFASAVAISRSGKWVASAGWDKTLKVWNAVTGEIKFNIPNQPGVGHSVAFSPDERVFASATSSGNVRIWNLETGNMNRELTFSEHPGRVWAIAFKPDDARALAVGADRLLGLWDPTTGAVVKELLPTHRSGVLSLAWSSDGRLLATGSGDVDNKQDGSIGVWAIGDLLSAGSGAK